MQQHCLFYLFCLNTRPGKKRIIWWSLETCKVNKFLRNKYFPDPSFGFCSSFFLLLYNMRRSTHYPFHQETELEGKLASLINFDTLFMSVCLWMCVSVDDEALSLLTVCCVPFICAFKKSCWEYIVLHP